MRTVCIIFLALLFQACSSSKNTTPAGADSISISARALPDTSSYALAVRVFTPKTAIQELSKELKDSLWYRMDSCFYLNSGGEKIYPEGLEAVAGANKNCFEYLLLFDRQAANIQRPVSLVYHDRYLDGKTHSFQINND